jgi:hypothetical protein
LAINSLVEQGATTLAELNDNYRFARKQVGTLLVSLVQEDIGAEPYKVSIEGNGTRRTVMLNQVTQDEAGFTYRTNDVVNMQMRVDLEDVPDTPSYRAQQFQMMTELVKSLPPELQPLLADFMVRASDLPFRHEVADRITKALGLDQGDGQEQEAQDPAAAQEQAMMQMQQQQMQLQLEEQAAKVQKAQIEAQGAQAKIQQQAMDAAMKQQTGQMKMLHEDDKHAASMDEQALGLVQKLEQQGQEHAVKTQSVLQQQKQGDEAHRAKLQAMKNKPKSTPAKPKR